MTLRIQARTILAAGLTLLAGCFPVGCSGGEPKGQFGVYHSQNKTLRLPTGQQFTVYRLKSWTFADGSPPALQLEYELPVSVDDTAAVRTYARSIWPVFVRYLDAHEFRSAIVTATNFRRSGTGAAWTSRQRSFGLIAERGADGGWHFQNDPLRLPPGDSSSVAGIFEYTGARLLPSAVTPPSQ